MPLPSVPEADSVESLLQDRAGALWIGTGAGLYRAAGTGAPWSPWPVPLPAPDHVEAEIEALRTLRGPHALFRRGEPLALMPFTFLR